MTRAVFLLAGAATRALHGVARVALRLQSPIGARRTVARIGALLPPFDGVEDARAVAAMLSSHGSCLSRSLVVAARLPGSDVVIGVDPRRRAHLDAHAWVELGTEVVDGMPGASLKEPIARL